MASCRHYGTVGGRTATLQSFRSPHGASVNTMGSGLATQAKVGPDEGLLLESEIRRDELSISQKSFLTYQPGTLGERRTKE